jgi:hypothetical protein
MRHPRPVPVRFHNIEEVLIAELAFAANNGDFVGVQNDGRALRTAIGRASKNAAGQLKEV